MPPSLKNSSPDIEVGTRRAGKRDSIGFGKESIEVLEEAGTVFSCNKAAPVPVDIKHSHEIRRRDIP
jgi:hypothetical protein